VSDETIDFDLDRLTLGELEEIEEIAGFESVQRMMAGQMSAKALTAVAYIVKRQTDPDFTLEDARAIKVTAIKTSEDTPEGKDAGIAD
jgi:hypothetical protein